MRLPARFEEYLRNPPEGSAIRQASEFGIDLALTFENMYAKTMEQRLERLNADISFAPELARWRDDIAAQNKR